VAGRRTALKVRGAAKFRVRYNLGPQGYLPVVRHAASGENDSEREVCIMRWGLVPSFAKRSEDYDAFKGGSSTFNTRVEGAESSGLWRRLLDSKRCVVLLDGFYEWKVVGKGKVPMFIRNHDNYNGHTILASSKVEEKADLSTGASTPSDANQGPSHAPLMLAALYDVWRSEGSSSEGEVESASILTMEPDGTAMMGVHDRMPVFLTPETAALWLDPGQKWTNVIGTVVSASRLHAQHELLLCEVSTLVSNIRNESADCILSKKDHDARQLSKGIGRFFQKKNGTETTNKQHASVNDDNRGCFTELSNKRKIDSQQTDELAMTKIQRVIELE